MADCNYLEADELTRCATSTVICWHAADGTEVNKTYIIDIRKYHFCIGNP